MRRSELSMLYKTTYRTDPATGKDRAVYEYTGKYFAVDRAALGRAVPRLWLGWGLALAAFVTAGLLPARAGSFTLVTLWYMCCLLPLFYLLLALIRLTRLREKITEVDRAEGFTSAVRSGWALTVLGALWMITDVALMIACGLPAAWAADAGFLVCGAAAAAMGTMIARLASRLHLHEIT